MNEDNGINNSEMLQIDRDKLDEELINQSLKYYQIAEKHAYAVSRRDEAYDYIKQVDAELYSDFRRKADEAGHKITETAINSLVLADELHKKAVEVHLQSKLEVDILAALRDAISQRSYMLRDLVELYLSGYYSTTSIPDRRDKTLKANRLEKEVKNRRRLASTGSA